jgi:hypothetical protein
MDRGLTEESGRNNPCQQVYPEITGRLCAVYSLDLNIRIVQLTGEHLAEHFGKVSGAFPQEPSSGEQARSLSVNVVYTGPEATIAALRAADSLARDLSATVHIRAMIAVPHQLAIEFAFTSVQFLKQLLSDLVERVGSKHCEYVLHIYVCRSRIETLLRVLRPSSLVVIGGWRRLWPTAESRLSKAAISAGHSVAFVDVRAF